MITADVEVPAGMSEAERMANVGIEVVCKAPALGTLRVRELTLENLIGLVSDLAVVLETITTEPGADKADDHGMHFMVRLLQEPQMLASVQKIAAVACNKSPEAFVGVGVADWLKLLVALKKVTDWEEVRALFFVLVPANSFAGLLAKGRTAVKAQ